MKVGERVQVYRKYVKPESTKKVKSYEGTFLKWGLNYDEFENGVGTFTVAIIMLDDGNITMEFPTNVQFLKDEANNDKKS